MPQMNFYALIEIAGRILRKTQASHKSVPKYLANLMKREVTPDWPEGFFEEVVGG